MHTCTPSVTRAGCQAGSCSDMMVSEEVAFYLPQREPVNSRNRSKGNKESYGRHVWYFNKRQICGPFDLPMPTEKIIIVKCIYIMYIGLIGTQNVLLSMNL